MRLRGWLWLALLGLPAAAAAAAGNTTAPTAFPWLRAGRWVFPENRHPSLTDRVRYCRAGTCTRQIGTPESVLSVLAPFAQGRMLCDIGCRTGEVLELMKDRASRLYGIELNPRYARTAKQKGLPVVIGDAFKVPLPPNCETVYFWVKAPIMHKFIRLVAPQLKATPGSLLILPAEFMEFRELQTLLDVHQQYGGELLKIPFHEGDGFRQFGVILFLLLRFSASTAKDLSLPLLTPQTYAAGVADFEKHGWLFPPEATDMALPDSGPGITRTSLSALRALAQGRHFCDLYARDGALLHRMSPHTASVHGLVEKAEEVGAVAGFNVSTYDRGVPPSCDFLFVSHTLDYHLRIAADLARAPRGPSARRTLVVATHILDRVGTFRFWAAQRTRCRMLKVPGDDPKRGVSLVVFFVFELEGGSP
eukprot:EG_transcript_10904